MACCWCAQSPVEQGGFELVVPALRRPPSRRATRFRAVRPARAAPPGGPKLEIASFSGEAFSCWAYASDHQFAGDAAYINLEIEALHRRTREMPGQTSRD